MIAIKVEDEDLNLVEEMKRISRGEKDQEIFKEIVIVATNQKEDKEDPLTIMIENRDHFEDEDLFIKVVESQFIKKKTNSLTIWISN